MHETLLDADGSMVNKIVMALDFMEHLLQWEEADNTQLNNTSSHVQDR